VPYSQTTKVTALRFSNAVNCTITTRYVRANTLFARSEL